MKLKLSYFLSISLSITLLACNNTTTDKKAEDQVGTDSTQIVTSDTIIAETDPEPKVIEIEKTPCTLNNKVGFDQIMKMPRITADQRAELKIDDIKKTNGISISSLKNKELVKGKTYFEDGNRKVLSIVNAVDDHAIFEFLVSYDADGNVADCIQVGLHMLYAGDYNDANISGNKVTIVVPDQELDGEFFKGSKTTYEITPEMKFKKI